MSADVGRAFPRIMISAGSSGSGKTMVTCGLLQAIRNRGLRAASFKCGPDYIDPMFHSGVIGTQSVNLDTFFTSPELTRALFMRRAAGCDISVLEGVMGFYDGLGGVSVRASAYDVAAATDTPVILVVDCQGTSLSLAAYIKGFSSFREDSRIKGVILNRISGMLWSKLRNVLERETGLPCLGYVPKLDEALIDSRHLGLVMPQEIPALRQKLERLAAVLEHTLDVDAILRLARTAPAPGPAKDLRPRWHSRRPLRIGVAKDEAFCFIYEDNLALLREMGAETVFFSPLHDRRLPEKLDGILLYGGYPELYAAGLSENKSMRDSVADALKNGLPCMAECGGFMYLHEELEDMEGRIFPMTGVIRAGAFRTDKLVRFGYVLLRPRSEVFLENDVGDCPGHEFHYYDSKLCGSGFYAEKPAGGAGWECIHTGPSLMAGFPHLYYYGNRKLPEAFLKRCEQTLLFTAGFK